MLQRDRLGTKIFPWLVWGVAGLFVLLQFLLQTSTSVMIQDLEQAFHIDVVGVSLLSSSFFYTYLFLQIPAGLVVDRFGARITLIVCMFSMVIANIMFAKAQSLVTAEISRILLGVFSAPAVVATLYLAARWFPAHYFALLAGLTEMLGMIGGAAGQAFLAHFVQGVGWRTTLLGCSVAGFILACCAYALVQDKSDDVKISSHGLSRRLPFFVSIWRVVSMPQAWINGVFSGLLFATVAAFAGFWCIPFLMAYYSISLSAAASASAVIFIGTAFGAPLLGWLSDRIGMRCLLMRLMTFLVCVTLSVILFFPWIPFALMVILLFLLGIFSGIYALPFAVMRDITPSEIQGAAMGFTNMMCILLGAPIFQPIIGWFVRWHAAGAVYSLGDYQYALALLPVSLAVAFGLTFFIQETYCRKQY